MKSLLSLSALALVTLVSPGFAHGPGHVHRDTEDLVDQDVVGTSGPVTTGTRASATTATSPSGKSFKAPVETETSSRWWGASLSTGWESRHVHYGVDETGPGGAFTTELSLWVHNFSFSVWNGFGTGNEFEEWDFTVSYRADLGPVFFIPGYNFRYSPGHGGDEHDHADEEHDDHDAHEHAEHEHEGHDHSGHNHKTYGNELFFVLGTDRIPYVTPTMAFIWDLNNTPGALLEFRVDGEVPLYKDILTLQPYALLAVNLGYNTNDDLGWNNFQFGLEADWKINRTISVYGGVNYSVAMTALQSIDQPNVVWANVGVRFQY